MSDAHEKTRIRQLEDAAAHWEHKYVNARQYNRNLEERCQKLEAALRKIAAYSPGDLRPLEDEIAIWRIATEALGTTAETKAECIHEWSAIRSGWHECVNPGCKARMNPTTCEIWGDT